MITNRDPLLHRWKHTTEELDADPFAWFEGPRGRLGASPAKPEHPAWKWAAGIAVALLVIAVRWAQ